MQFLFRNSASFPPCFSAKRATLESVSAAIDYGDVGDSARSRRSLLIGIPRWRSGFQKKLRFGTSEGKCSIWARLYSTDLHHVE